MHHMPTYCFKHRSPRTQDVLQFDIVTSDAAPSQIKDLQTNSDEVKNDKVPENSPPGRLGNLKTYRLSLLLT